MTYEKYVDSDGIVHKVSSSTDIHKVVLYLTTEQLKRLYEYEWSSPNYTIDPNADPADAAWLGFHHLGDARDDYIKYVKSS